MLETSVGSLTLTSPVMTASGTAGHGAELSAYFDLSTIGALVIKSLAPYPWEGNKPLRVYSTPAGMINAVGLQGPGVQGWKKQELPELLDAGATVVASIWGKTVEEYHEAAQMLADAPADVVAVEVNISCPHTKGTGLFCYSTDLTSEVIEATKVCGRPLWAKLSPNVGPTLPEIAKAAFDSGAEAVTVSNTYNGLSVDPVTRKPNIGKGAGGVSGAAIHPLAVKSVFDVHQAYPEIPIVAAGGVSCVEDVVEFALVGASAVQIGTATLADPRIVGRLAKELEKWCKKHGIASYSELIGQVEMP